MNTCLHISKLCAPGLYVYHYKQVVVNTPINVYAYLSVLYVIQRSGEVKEKPNYNMIRYCVYIDKELNYHY